MKIGICTGGGDCPGLNAAIRALVKSAIKHKDIELYGIKNSFNGLKSRPLSYTQLNRQSVVDIYHRGGTILGTFNKGAYKEETSNKDLDLICEGYNSLELDCLIVIGGEGTQSIAQQLIEKKLNVIGIPKTIDNDLPKTEQTIGFSSCVDLVAESVLRLQSTAESHHRIMILEVMGRDSGFIGLYGGLAGGAHIILIPEIAFNYNAICEKIDQRRKLGRNNSVIVVSEGAYEAGQDSRPKNLTQNLSKNLAEMTNMETRVTVLGHLQRGGAPSPEDRLLATRLGVYAMNLAIKKTYNRIVMIHEAKTVDIEYSAINKWERKLVSLDNELMQAAEAIGISLGR
ncbi:MAG: 6-phosphofructokinase [Zetaproteobacteria bacterium]|nr:6-phosphofructokinase [Pseudobdellovibrionaceae bacterium]